MVLSIAKGVSQVFAAVLVLKFTSSALEAWVPTLMGQIGLGSP